MGIDDTFFARIATLAAERKISPGGSAAILGHCTFLTDWASGDNRRDLTEFQKRLGLGRVETLDIGGRPTVTLDLHAPLPEDLRGQFDLVIDAGTMHCCFDVGMVWRNSLELLKTAGTIIHQSALTGYMGRAYYSINPALFHDFYTQNGFDILALEVRVPPRPDFPQRFARLRHRLAGRNPRGFHSILGEGVFARDADRVSLRFSADANSHAPYLPNDGLILCAASRAQAAPFVRPIPGYFLARR